MAESEVINNSVQFFEGVEKLLEIWFAPNEKNKMADLRKIPRSKWDALLKIVRCEIISFSRNDQVDAYVLSESSMFVSRRRWILKTCGTTTPLQCLEPLLELAEQIAGYTCVEDVFYSRKNFKRPELQCSPHKHFEQEVALLDTFFDNGVAYCIGTVNRDCWYLYTLDHGLQDKLGLQDTNDRSIGWNGCWKPKSIDVDPDQTIEILMTELDPKVMSIFTKESCTTAAEATEKSGIHKILPNMVIDDFLFEPCGYSMNGIAKSGYYMTIHITPEEEFSYVSFESNVSAANYAEIISRVIDTFRPGKFVVTIFANKNSAASGAPRELEKVSSFGDWVRRDSHFCRFARYDFTYALFSKFPS
ncbi:S-adenosylmethionine decarboxylase proenzyme [Ctenocephalides felis]|uniref:S-adenosylmethionine decarboxylase proenzyme n=2 Tax=Ctenocephalides felis TaxID=7515 RepID=UPI000E6E15EB|nr:S-adenosylmethionine decarboxylase proenzyme [Ctenocephalides felis]